MHGVEGQHHPHGLRTRVELNRHRHLVRLDVRDGVDKLGEGEPRQRHNLGVVDERRGG